MIALDVLRLYGIIFVNFNGCKLKFSSIDDWSNFVQRLFKHLGRDCYATQRQEYFQRFFHYGAYNVTQ